MTTLLLAVIVFALAMAGMAVGVMFSNRCLRGSCGGPAVIGPDGEPIDCEVCPHNPARKAG